MDKKINFFIIGAAKSGTTALTKYLNCHQGIFIPEQKELHHFATDLLDPSDKLLDSDAYFKYYENSSPDQVVGDASAFYLLSESAPVNIHKHNPNAKIIAIIRNPIEAAYSLHSQLVFNGEENIVDFFAALKAEAFRKNGNMLPPKTRIIKKHLYLHTVSYARQIHNYKKIFKDQLKVILFDDLVEYPEKIYMDLLHFLGLEAKSMPDFKQINKNKVVKSRFLQKIQHNPSNLIRSIVKTLIPSASLRTKIRTGLKENNIRYQDRKAMDLEARKYLFENLYSEISNIEKILDRDLSKWKR